MDRLQINVRLPPGLMELLDKKRIDLLPEMGKIPSRSDVVRLALDAYLEASAPAADGPKPSAKRRSS
ncbi:ribbon-helix-helix protein, CopG family [Thiomonas sp. FB-Cd]|uniref:ribbon-helix-helix protein, CopG family n=1 Tax=Thiomonas sp. FB-Cd TaxID=1158292 RepID=UPI0004DF921D|nr:ribbon-helix-helix protein, CopG family [Thiomonas sp. FB-Cd]